MGNLGFEEFYRFAVLHVDPITRFKKHVDPITPTQFTCFIDEFNKLA
jgi:hypothetical protein